MSLKVIGALPGAKIVTGWSKSGGDYTEYIWRGEKLLMQAKYAGLRGNCDDIQLLEDGLLTEVRARFNRAPIESGDETPQDEVRLSANRVAKDIREHDAFTECSADQIELINNYINGDTEKQEEATAAIEADATFPDDAYDIFTTSIVKGVRHFIIYQPVLTLVRVASGAYTFAVSYTNVGAVYSTESLQEEQDIGPRLRFTLPNYTAADNTNFAYGWLKHYPEYQPGSGGKYVFTQEWEYGVWSRAIYGDPI